MSIITTAEMQDAKLVACGFGICEDDREVGAYLHGVLDGWMDGCDCPGSCYDSKRIQWCYNTGACVGAMLAERRRISQ